MNKLERIMATIGEEAGEVGKIVGKIQRFGPDSYHPDDPEKVTNIEKLEQEVVDLLTMYSYYLENIGIKSGGLEDSLRWADMAEKKVRQWEKYDAMFRDYHNE